MVDKKYHHKDYTIWRVNTELEDDLFFEEQEDEVTE